MKKAKIYIPTKTAMQSGKKNSRKWILEFETLDTGINSFMGWETSTDTMSEVKLEFDSKDLAINYAKKLNINYCVIEPQKRKVIKKTYADNFIKNQ
jgi:NADH dehydrogenase (ubiquinone) Fe-S protein 4